jgi:hypothetical protein
MCDRRSPYEPIGFKEERKKRMRAILKNQAAGLSVSREDLPNPYDLNDMALLTEIMLEDERT